MYVCCVNFPLSNVYLLIKEKKRNKAYRPNAHLLYFIMHYNGSII